MQLAWSRRAWPQLGEDAFFAILRSAGLTSFVHDLGTIEGPLANEVTWPQASGVHMAAVSLASTLAEADDLAAVSEVVRQAAAHGARVVNLHVLVVLQEFASLPDFLVGNLRHLADLAASQGLTVCLDSACGLGGSHRAIARTMKELDHPALRLQFDPGSYVHQNSGSQVEVAVQRLLGWVGSLNLSDAMEYDPEPSFPPLGQGAAVDFARLLQLIDAMQLDVPCEIYFRPLTRRPATEGQIEKWLVESLRTLKQCGWRW